MADPFQLGPLDTRPVNAPPRPYRQLQTELGGLFDDAQRSARGQPPLSAKVLDFISFTEGEADLIYSKINQVSNLLDWIWYLLRQYESSGISGDDLNLLKWYIRRLFQNIGQQMDEHDIQKAQAIKAYLETIIPPNSPEPTGTNIKGQAGIGDFPRQANHSLPNNYYSPTQILLRGPPPATPPPPKVSKSLSVGNPKPVFIRNNNNIAGQLLTSAPRTTINTLMKGGGKEYTYSIVGTHPFINVDPDTGDISLKRVLTQKENGQGSVTVQVKHSDPSIPPVTYQQAYVVSLVEFSIVQIGNVKAPGADGKWRVEFTDGEPFNRLFIHTGGTAEIIEKPASFPNLYIEAGQLQGQMKKLPTNSSSKFIVRITDPVSKDFKDFEVYYNVKAAAATPAAATPPVATPPITTPPVATPPVATPPTTPPPPPPIVITPATAGPFEVGKLVNIPFNATPLIPGGFYRWKLETENPADLPKLGLSFQDNNLQGSPAESGEFSVIITALNPATRQSGTVRMIIKVEENTDLTEPITFLAPVHFGGFLKSESSTGSTPPHIVNNVTIQPNGQTRTLTLSINKDINVPVFDDACKPMKDAQGGPIMEYKTNILFNHTILSSFQKAAQALTPTSLTFTLKGDGSTKGKVPSSSGFNTWPLRVDTIVTKKVNRQLAQSANAAKVDSSTCGFKEGDDVIVISFKNHGVKGGTIRIPPPIIIATEGVTSYIDRNGATQIIKQGTPAKKVVGYIRAALLGTDTPAVTPKGGKRKTRARGIRKTKAKGKRVGSVTRKMVRKTRKNRR